MHPCRAFCCSSHFSDLLVRQSFIHTQEEDLPLGRRQLPNRTPHFPLCLAGNQSIQRGVFGGGIHILQAPNLPPPPKRSSPIHDQASCNRKQPCPERAVASKTLQRRKRPHKRVLHNLLGCVAFAHTAHVPGQRGRMPLHQGGRRPFVSRLPTLNQRSIEGVVPAGEVLYHCGVNR